VMGMVQTSRCHGRYWMGGHQEKADPTRFHACVTNPFKCATCCSRSLALILRSWHSHPEARSPLCAKEFQRTDECEGIDHTYQLSSKSDMGHPRKMLSFEFQLGGVLDDGIYSLTTESGLPGCSSRDVIYCHGLT